VVQQLKVHTIGGVVTPAEPLLVIVPNDAAIEIEALVLNRDIGFVNEGQLATVKVDAFPFTRYGTIAGDLVTESKDAASDEKLGLVYPSRIKLHRTSLRIDTRDIALTPGMAVTVEFKRSIHPQTRELSEPPWEPLPAAQNLDLVKETYLASRLARYRESSWPADQEQVMRLAKAGTLKLFIATVDLQLWTPDTLQSRGLQRRSRTRRL
jgi:hypothetical protein